MNTARAGVWCLAGLTGLALPARAEAPPAVAPVLGEVLARMGPAGPGATASDRGLFGRLAEQQTVRPRAAARSERLVPALAYAMEQLDPASFVVLRPVPVGGSGARLRTGDVFVLQFSTSLPGQVRLENIDPAGRIVDLGTYTVFVDQLNRIPRDKGIQLQGQPGLERLRFYFYPCLPAEAAAKAWAAEYRGRLPACSSPGATRALAPGGALGQVTPRALVNLAQPDPTLAFAGSTEYQPGDLTLMEAQIRHEAPAHGR